jgi:allantoinase
MALPESFLEYPKRRHGMDHDRYQWSNLFERKPVALPNNKKVVLSIVIPLEFFPLNPSGKPFKAPGSMVTAYPDFRHYTTRDYGNRVGVYRFLKIFEELNIKATFAVNARVAERYPSLIKDIISNHHEIMAYGIDMDTLHYGGMDEAQERSQVSEALQILETITGQPIRGWMSPAMSESFNTLDILAENNIKYVGDWANDDLPYPIANTNNNLWAMPVSQELSDRQIITNYHHTEAQFVEQILDQYECLSSEAQEYGGRVLSMVIHPYIMGLPYRIWALEKILQTLIAKPDVWAATASEVLACWTK